MSKYYSRWKAICREHKIYLVLFEKSFQICMSNSVLRGKEDGPGFWKLAEHTSQKDSKQCQLLGGKMTCVSKEGPQRPRASLPAEHPARGSEQGFQLMTPPEALRLTGTRWVDLSPPRRWEAGALSTGFHSHSGAMTKAPFFI